MFLLTRNKTLFGLLLPTFFTVIVPGLMRIYSNLEKQSYSFEVFNSGGGSSEKNVFDFIIVGAGSAGCVLANRLSENFSVLLLERAGEPNPWTMIPMNSLTMCRNPDVDYMYLTKPQTVSCLGMKDRACAWPRGKGLGGSSNINWQIYLRGHPQDYDNWANITGDERWNYRNVLPFFMKSEDYCVQCENKPNDETFNPLFHHKNGFLTVGRVYRPSLVENFLEASEWDGVKMTDLNGPYSEGCAQLVQTNRLGSRCSTKVAFLDPIRHRKTLTIRKYARAYKLLIRERTNDVYGVEYEHVGIPKTAFASKEVIVSSGSIETPKLLMLSGIGPKEHLQSLGIPVLKDSPVGKNLQDHLGTYVGPFLVDSGKSLIPERDISFFSYLEYIIKGTGYLTQTGVHAISMWTSSLANSRGEFLWPDVQFLFSGIGVSEMWSAAYSTSFNMLKDPIEQFFATISGKDAFSILVFNERPQARGEITLASRNYLDDPIIDPKYYLDEDQIDIKVVVEAAKRAVHIAENAPSFKSLNSQLSPVPYPLCDTFPLRSDEYWECLARHFSFNIFHYVGTAAMGRETSPDAVVDSELRVIGTRGLRVIDGSIMPDIVSVNTNAPIIMVAERGAQLILDTHLK